MKKTFRYKLYNSKRNQYLHRRIDLAASVYNHCIALHKRYYQLYKKFLNKYQLQKHLTKIKAFDKYFVWKEIGSQAIQDITDRIDKGYQLFFNGLKNKKKIAPPSFKKRRRYKSFTLKQVGFKLIGTNKIKIGKKIYSFHKSREIEGEINTLTIKRDKIGDIYLYFSCEVKTIKTERVMTGKMAGFDFGLKTFLTSTDKDIPSPLFFKQGIKSIRKASKSLSSKRKGSNNRKKAVLTLARVHKKIAAQRNDYHFKLANVLAKQYDYLFFEDLNLQGMKKLWGRKVSDLGFAAYIKIQEYCCVKQGSTIGFIDRFYPSSKTCNVCLSVTDVLELKTREWICRKCGTFHSRDKNAALNIRREGASSLGLGVIRPPSGGFLCSTPESHRL